MALENDNDALTPGYQLHWYEILDIIGRGGFGITYLARDNNLDLLVAIKEYLPDDFARRKDDSTVQPRTDIQSDLYEWGRERFVTEARILAKFTHPNIVRVISVFEQNNTAYMVMEYAQGEDLSSIYKKRAQNYQPLDEQEYLDIFIPICDGLALVHKEGFIHRDIKPANIYICNEAQPLLLDFGSARQSVEHKTRALTSLVTVGYAPFEQYQEGTGKQGPWTDIYSLGASIYAGVTGHKPEDALARGGHILESGRDSYKPLSRIAAGQFSEHFLLAVDHALMFKAEDRPQHILRWADMLLGRLAPASLSADMYVPMDTEELESTVLMPSDRHSARNSMSGNRAIQTARSGETQGLVDKLGQRIRELGQDVEQPVEAGIARLREFTKTGIFNVRSYISNLPANAVFGTVVVTLLVLTLVYTVINIREPEDPAESNLASETRSTEALQANDPKADNIGKLMDRANQAYSAGQYTRPPGHSAYDYLQKVLAMNPADPRVKNLLIDMQRHLLNRAQVQLADGNPAKALQSLEQLLVLDPTNSQAGSLQQQIINHQKKLDDISNLLASAESRLKQKRYLQPEKDSAYYYYTKVLSLDNANRVARSGLDKLQSTVLSAAQDAYNNGGYSKALRYLEALEKTGLSTSEADVLHSKLTSGQDKARKIAGLLSTARTHMQKHRYSTPENHNAFSSYSQVLKLDRTNGEARAGIGKIKDYYRDQFNRHINAKDLKRASYDLQRIQAIAPGSSMARTMEKTLLAAKNDISQKTEIEQISELIGAYKVALENRDLAALKRLTRFRPGREQFVRDIFKQYRNFSVDISGFQYIQKEHRAHAQVEVSNMIDKDNQPVVPGNWSKFKIDTRRDKNGRSYIYW